MKNLKLFGTALTAILLCLNFSACSNDDETQSDNPYAVISYSTIDDSTPELYKDHSGGVKIISNKYDKKTGFGKIRFKSDVIVFEQIIEGDKIDYIKLPLTVEEIGSNAFYCCEELRKLDLPRRVSEIGQEAFKGCYSLTYLAIPEQVTRIQRGTFDNCSKLEYVKIPKNVTEIGENAFWGCSSLDRSCISNLDFLENVTEIGRSAFRDCSSLTSVIVPYRVTSIKSSTFYGCSKLTDISFPKCLTEIHGDALNGCSSLKTIKIEATTPPKVYADFSDDIKRNCTLYVPEGYASAYKTAHVWREFLKIKEVTFIN